METADMDAMAAEMEGKEDVPRTLYGNMHPNPIHRFSQHYEEEEDKSGGCRCWCPLWFVVTWILFALILGITGVAAYNLYANITNGQKLTTVEQVANQDTIVQILDINTNNTLELALEQFVLNVNGDLRRIEADIDTLRNNTSDNIGQIKADIEMAKLSLSNRLSQLENSTLNRMELDRVEADLATLENRVSVIEDDLSSGKSLTGIHPLLLTVIGLLVLLSLCY